VAQKIQKKYKIIYLSNYQRILMYGAQVWQIPTREINKILSTEMDVNEVSEKPRMERIKNEHVQEIMGVKGSRAS
jgi:hypothetical protein